MAVSTHTLIAPEGLPLIAASFVVTVILLYLFGVYASPALLLVFISMWLYRDPLRKVPSMPRGVISPVEGKVTLAENHPDPYLGRDAKLIRINMGITSVYSLRSVIEGKILQQWLDQESADEHDVAHALHIQTDEEDDVVVVLRAGRVFRRISCNANIGERIGQGHRCGIIPLGSSIDVFLPENAQLNVSPGDTVIGGETVIAELKK